MSCDDRPAQAGFTLLEALVGLAIVAIGFALAFVAMPESLRAQTSAHTLETASNLAESLLAQAGQIGAMPDSGEAGGFAWRIESAPLASDTGIRAHTIRVRVTWPEGGSSRAILVETVVLGGETQAP